MIRYTNGIAVCIDEQTDPTETEVTIACQTPDGKLGEPLIEIQVTTNGIACSVRLLNKRVTVHNEDLRTPVLLDDMGNQE